VGTRVEAANQPVFRWKLLAGAASVAAAAAIGWNWIGGAPQAPVGAQLAQQVSPAPVLASAVQPPADTTATRVLIGDRQQPQVMLRDPRLDALLEAHQQAGGASHMPSGFLRNATFEGQSR
jgi:sigma-E factor negative regulatory protein RseA